jgi:hypothetical protein
MDTKELAEQYGLEQSSIDSYITYVQDNLYREPKLREFLKTNPEEFMRVSMENWMRVMDETYNELIEGKSGFAKKFRDEIWEINNNVGQ